MYKVLYLKCQCHNLVSSTKRQIELSVPESESGLDGESGLIFFFFSMGDS